MLEKTYRCSCGEVRKQTNYWWLIFKLPSGAIKVQEWSDSKARRAGALHICGQNCLNKFLSVWMQERTRLHRELEQETRELDEMTAEEAAPEYLN